MADVTCALLVVTPSGKIVMVHPTNAPYLESWSLPKGIKEHFETEEVAAARECFEETGLDFRDKTDDFEDLGRHPYVKGKDLHLFMYQTKDEIDSTLLECTTHFTDRKGNQVVEVDRYSVSDINSAKKLLNPKQLKLIMNSVFGKDAKGWYEQTGT